MKTVIEMAREAGFEVHERKQQARVGLDALCGIDSTAKLERFAEIVRADNRNRWEHNYEVLMNALWKACGDDAKLVEETIKSQGELK